MAITRGAIRPIIFVAGILVALIVATLQAQPAQASGHGEGSELAGVQSNGQWMVPGTDPFFFGDPGDTPFLGDWNGDGTKTPGLFRPSTGFAYVRDSNDFGVADREWFMGNPGDIPLVGDWDGDGIDSVGVYRPNEGKVYLRNAQTTGVADVEYFFGNPGDTPFSGDFDGDGIDTVGLYRETAGLVYFRNEQSTGAAESEFFFGAPGDIFIGGDWDGDGIDTVGVIRPSTSTFFGRNSNTQGIADFEVQVDTTLAPIVTDSGVLSLAQALRSLDSNTLLAAIGILEEEGLLPPPEVPATIFAPTDAAFDALPPGLLDDALADPFFLADIVGYHAIEGLWTPEELIAEGYLQAFNGGVLTFSEGSLYVNGVQVGELVESANSYIFSISVVLQPPEPLEFLVSDFMRGSVIPGGGDPDARGLAFFEVIPLGEGALICGFFETTLVGATALHIHLGVDGDVVWNSGVTAESFFPLGPPGLYGAEYCGELNDPLVLEDLLANPSNYYAMAHSEAYPAGAIAEQVVFDFGGPPPPAYFAALMLGDYEVGTEGDPDGTGSLAFIAPPTDNGEWCINFEAQDLGEITGAHVHIGVAGVNGGILLDLDISGVPQVPGWHNLKVLMKCIAVPAEVQDAIVADPGGHYVNFHTDEYPAGAVRGQIQPGPGNQFESFIPLSGEESVPGPGEGGGFSGMIIYPEDNALIFFIDIWDTDETPTAAHIHIGGPGETGGVLLNLEIETFPLVAPYESDGYITTEGVIKNIPPEVMDQLLAAQGNLYVNVHSPNYPDGLMRGQMEVFPAGPPPL